MASSIFINVQSSMSQDRSQVRTQIATKQEPKISSSKDSEHGLCLIIYSKVAFSSPLVSGLRSHTLRL
ncbi:hypothetical protein ACB092_09G054100 [Castanea dentata]